MLYELTPGGSDTVLLTGCTGEAYERMAEITSPLMRRYCKMHAVDFMSVDLHESNGGRPASWNKVLWLMHCLAKGYRTVLWLDADVVIFDSSRNIFAAIDRDLSQSLVEHQTPSGSVPNCGVWAVNQKMLPVLHQVWEQSDLIDHCWWEQAAVMRLMGYRLEPGPYAELEQMTELCAGTQYLDNAWNHHPHDKKPSSQVAFYHVTQYPDRLEQALEFAAAAT